MHPTEAVARRLAHLAGVDDRQYRFERYRPPRPVKYVNLGDDTFYAISGTYAAMLSSSLHAHFRYMRDTLRVPSIPLQEVVALVTEGQGRPTMSNAPTLAGNADWDNGDYGDYRLTPGYMKHAENT